MLQVFSWGLFADNIVLFKEKGCYNHLTKTASQKKIVAASADQNPEAEATEAKEHKSSEVEPEANTDS
ncbi:hypothetical protein CUMW_041590 [Citrus unshiu]|nr:hypothetical protein CUMW_041590 [Citrus unshiu]